MDSQNFDQFSGTAKYIVSQDLRDVVNVSIALGRPLLVKGEPGTGKTLLAHSIAEGLGKKLLIWNVKSTTKAKDGLYIYDTVRRLNDSRFGTGDVSNIKNYIELGVLGKSFTTPEERPVLLIDEVDKADIEFPNDLLNELDEMSFYIPETEELVKAQDRPIVIITSNAEKELPDAFLRRCVFHYIQFPDEATHDARSSWSISRTSRTNCSKRSSSNSTGCGSSTNSGKSLPPVNSWTGCRP